MTNDNNGVSITVYSKPNCMKCEMTKNVLRQDGLEYDVVDVMEDESALLHVKDELGFSTMPVVESSIMEAFGDFQVDLLHELADKVKNNK